MQTSINKKRVALFKILGVYIVLSIVAGVGWRIYHWEEVKVSFLSANPV